MSSKKFLRDVISSVVSGDMEIIEAVNLLLVEMGRGGRILVCDAHFDNLEKELSALGYTTNIAQPSTGDKEIQQTLRSRVFITRDGDHFKNKKDMTDYRYGLIWVKSTCDDCILARKIESVLVKSHFSKNLIQVVKV